MEQTCKELQQLQAKELDIFKVFVEICQHHDLQYFLLGGTLLGAIRHQGFIPWDDDIDVAMPRKDYEAFLKVAQDNLPEYYFLQTSHTDAEYLNNYLKIRDSRTTFIEEEMKDRNINHGLFIDIFPLDYYPDNFFGQLFVDISQRILTARVLNEFHGACDADSWGKRIARKMLCVLWPDVKIVIRKRERLYQRTKKTNYFVNYSGAWGKKEIAPVAWLGEGRTLVFEGVSASVPKEAEKWLTQVYGDYMKLPPPEKRCSHHYTTIVDLERPYKEYTKDGSI